MKILAVGSGKNFVEALIFKCKCGAIWDAERNEVNFASPCLPYDVYMKCPYCNATKKKPNSTVGIRRVENVLYSFR